MTEEKPKGKSAEEAWWQEWLQEEEDKMIYRIWRNSIEAYLEDAVRVFRVFPVREVRDRAKNC